MRKNNRILAIDPGAKYMGVALIDKGVLVYCGVREIKDRRSPGDNLRACRKVILRMIKDYRPEALAIEKTFFAKSRSSALLNVLFDEISSIGKRRGLEVIGLAPNTVKKAVCGNGHASKAEVAKVMVSEFPELKVYLSQDRKWKEAYHHNMFDAIAVGMTALTDKRL